MAGSGFKIWATSDIVTAAAMNGFVQEQVVGVFADSSARSTAISSPSEGMVSWLNDTNSLEAYDGSSWAAVGGAATTTKFIFLAATAFTPPTTNGAAASLVDGTNLSYPVLDFDQTTEEHADTSFQIPSTYGAGNITVDVWWTAAGGSAAETVDWEVNVQNVSNDEVWDGALTDVGSASDALTATGDILKVPMPWSGTLPTAGDVTRFRLSRDVASDNLAADARLLSVVVSFSCTEAS